MVVVYISTIPLPNMEDVAPQISDSLYFVAIWHDAVPSYSPTTAPAREQPRHPILPLDDHPCLLWNVIAYCCVQSAVHAPSFYTITAHFVSGAPLFSIEAVLVLFIYSKLIINSYGPSGVMFRRYFMVDRCRWPWKRRSPTRTKFHGSCYLWEIWAARSWELNQVRTELTVKLHNVLETFLLACSNLGSDTLHSSPI